MIIYLEGVDGSGKTTLAKAIYNRLLQIHKVYNVEVVEDGESLIPTRPDHPNRLNLTELVKQLTKMAKSIDTIYICDRGPISDILYRTFDNHQPVIDLQSFIWLWMNYNIGVITVHCDSDLSTKAMLDRGESNPIAVTHHTSLRYLYKQIMPLLGAIPYNMSEEPLSTVNLVLATLWQNLNKLKEIKTSLKEN